MTTTRAERYRCEHPMRFPHKPGDPFGWFEVPSSKTGPRIRILASPADEETEWEHVSVSLSYRCPTWDEMCRVKDLFWDEEDVCIQYHPPRSEYVSYAEFCLHIWRYTGAPPIPRPPPLLVGPTEAPVGRP